MRNIAKRLTCHIKNALICMSVSARYVEGLSDGVAAPFEERSFYVLYLLARTSIEHMFCFVNIIVPITMVILSVDLSDK